MKNKSQKICGLAIGMLFFSTTVSAQKKLKDGLVVLANGDTLHGKIDYRNWEKNPSQIQFESNSGATTYKPADISYFEATGEDSYLGRIVTKDMRPLDVGDLSDDDADVTITDTVFLRVLVNGPKLKLYEFVDFKPHFYIQSGGENKIEELLYKKYLNVKSSNMTEKKIFRQQLTAFAINSNAPADIIPKIERSNYRAQELRSIVRLLNGEDATTVKTSETKTAKSKKQILIGGGVQFYSFSFNGNIPQYTGLQFDNGIGPIVSAAYDIFGGRNEQRLALRLELAFNQIKLHGSQVLDEIGYLKKEYHLSVTQTNIIPGFAVIYHFISTDKVRVYAGLGAAYAFSSYPTNTLTSKNVDTGTEETTTPNIVPEKSWLIADALLGARINNKINLGLSTKLTGAFYNYSALGTKYFPVNLTVSYIFSTGKKNS